MRVWFVWLWWLLGLLAVTQPAWSRSFPSTPDALLDTEQRFGTALQGYVVSGCVPTPGAGASVTVAACRAYTLVQDDPPSLKGFEEAPARTLTLPSSDGTVWLVGRWHPGLTPAGWSCAPGVHYCWLSSPTQPTWPSGTLPLARLTVAGGGVTQVQALAPTSPLATMALDNTAYATQFGLRCDGVSDNSAALQAAISAVPAVGGVVVLPASEQDCPYSTTLDITKALVLRGAGGARGNPKRWRTILRYTGSGPAIHIHDLDSLGARLEGFELSHTGTATVGVDINNTAMVHLTDVTIANPPVLFSIAGIRVGDVVADPPHSIFVHNCYLRGSAPTGIWVVSVAEYFSLTQSKILRHTTDNVTLGRLSTEGPQGTATDVHLLNNTLENPEPGSNAVRINRAEGVWIKDNHFEVGPPTAGGNPARALQINATAERAAPVVFSDNRVNALNGATEVIVVAMDNTLLDVHRNWFSDNTGGSLTAHINNLGARYLTVGMNRIDGPAPLLKGLAYVTLEGNWRQSPANRTDGFWPYRLCQSATQTGNVGPSETTLGTCTILGNMLYEDGMGIQITASGRTAGNANTKRVRLYIASVEPIQEIYDSGALAGDNDHWQVDCTGVRSGTISMRVTCTGQMYDVQTGPTVSIRVITVSGWDGSKPVTVTGTGTATNDVLLEVFKVVVQP